MRKHIITMDTETGGFDPHTDALLSVGGCCSWNGSALDLFITADSQTTKKIEAGAAAVNGYDAAVWADRGALPFDHAFVVASQWVAARLAEKPDAVLVCHNLVHDLSFLRSFAQENGFPDLMPKLHRYVWRCSQQRFMGLMDEGLIEAGSASLNRLASLSMWPERRHDAHSALQDARMTLHGWLWMDDVVAEKRKAEA